MDLAAFRRLLDPAGQRLLADITAVYPARDELEVAQQFRSAHDPDLVAAALTQVTLRIAAAEKFGPDAASLYFTPDGLEQATHGAVAAHRARRIVRDRTGRAVVDLCCGIGADLLALARRGAAIEGVDSDPLVAAIAAANLDALGLTGRVTVADAASYQRPADALVFADPARRDLRGRVFDPSRYSPPWSFVERLLDSEAVVKVAPGLDHGLVPAGVEAEWVSLGGRLREAVLWSGELARHARRASVLTADGPTTELTDADTPDEAQVRDIAEYVYEPDDAVVRAHLVAGFAELVGGALVDPHLAYVSSARLVPTSLGRAYRVLEELPFKEKALRAALRDRDVGALTVKKRGIAVAPDELRRRLRLTGSQPATIVLTRTPRSAVALLVDPVRHIG